MKNKARIILALVLLLGTTVSAKTGFSLNWEHSFLTGKAILDGEGHEDYDFNPNVKGGRVLFVLRYNINEHLAFGLGSGASVSKLDASYEFWGYNEFSTAMFYVPIFGEVRGQFPVYEDLLRMFVNFRMGGSLSPLAIKEFSVTYSFDGGLFFEPMIGISLGSRRVLLDMGVGYSHQVSQLVEHYWRLPDDWTWSNNLPSIEMFDYYPFSLRQLSLNLGVNFLFGKK